MVESHKNHSKYPLKKATKAAKRCCQRPPLKSYKEKQKEKALEVACVGLGGQIQKLS